jgi:hypothetical protein
MDIGSIAKRKKYDRIMENIVKILIASDSWLLVGSVQCSNLILGIFKNLVFQGF